MQILSVHIRRETRLLGQEHPIVVKLVETDEGWFLVYADPTDVDGPRLDVFKLSVAVASDLIRQVTPEGWVFNQRELTLTDWLFSRAGVEEMGALGRYPELAPLAHV